MKSQDLYREWKGNVKDLYIGTEYQKDLYMQNKGEINV